MFIVYGFVDYFGFEKVIESWRSGRLLTDPQHAKSVSHKIMCSIVLNCVVLYCIILCCIVLYCIILYCIILYCIDIDIVLLFYCIVLYSIVLYVVIHPLPTLAELRGYCAMIMMYSLGHVAFKNYELLVCIAEER